MSTAGHRHRAIVVVAAGTSFLLGAATAWSVAAVQRQLEDVYVERLCPVDEEPVWHTENVSGTDCTRNGKVPVGYARYPAGRVATWSVPPDDYGNLTERLQEAYDVHPNRPRYPYLDDLLASYPERGCEAVPLRTVREIPVGPGVLRAALNPADDLCLSMAAPAGTDFRVEARQHGVRWVREGGANAEPLRVGTRGAVRVTGSVVREGNNAAEVFDGLIRIALPGVSERGAG